MKYSVDRISSLSAKSELGHKRKMSLLSRERTAEAEKHVWLFEDLLDPNSQVFSFPESLFSLKYKTVNNQNTKHTIYYSRPPTEDLFPESQLVVEKEQGA